MSISSTISNSAQRYLHNCKNSIIPLCTSCTISSFPFHPIYPRLCAAVRMGSDGMRKPVVQTQKKKKNVEDSLEDDDDGEEGEEDEWVDWEDQILEDTVPLVGFARMILHSGNYEIGDKLSPEHEKTIVEKLLAYHPECEKKIGSGIDYITVGYHPNFESSRCLFIVRKDGELVDFSYWKCIKGLIRTKYPMYAESFIMKHFRRRRDDK